MSGARRSRAWVLLLWGSMTVPSGCGASADGGGTETGGTETGSSTGAMVCENAPPESDASVALAQAYCEEIFGCHCPLQNDYETFEGCVVSLSAEFQLAFDTAQTHDLVYAPECAQLQVALARALGCDFPSAEIPMFCEDVLCDPYNGDLEVGEECAVYEVGRVSFSNCAPGLACEPDCGGCVDNATTRAEGEPCGTCFGFCDEGLTCSLEGQDELMGTCIVREDGGEGDPCESFLDCEDTLYCPDTECAPKLGEGGACETGVECKAGFYCFEQQCRAQKPPGEPCTTSDECIASCSTEGKCSFPLCVES